MTWETIRREGLRLDAGAVDSSRWCVIGHNPVGARVVVAKRDTEEEAVARMAALDGAYHSMTLVSPIQRTL